MGVDHFPRDCYYLAYKKNMNSSEEKKTYEISFLVSKTDGETALASILKQYNAGILYKSPLTETRLAYPIKKYKQGYFGFLNFSTEPENANKIMQSLKLNPDFLRALIITPPLGGRTAKNERTSRSKEIKPEPATAPANPKGTLSNEALEQKLEEILK